MGRKSGKLIDHRLTLTRVNFNRDDLLDRLEAVAARPARSTISIRYYRTYNHAI
jgi:hypothetical protein